MKHQFKRLAALISFSLVNNSNSAANLENSELNLVSDPLIKLGNLNISVSQLLAAHRSHSSHASHGSHRSSSGGGGSYRAPSVSPSYTSPTKKRSVINNSSNPLGQQARPLSSYPSYKPKNKLPTDKSALKNLIMRIQLTLKFEGYDSGPIDGIMGPKTRAAITKYKKHKGITSKGFLDTETLNALGVKGF